jgi:hypothetical protein
MINLADWSWKYKTVDEYAQRSYSIIKKGAGFAKYLGQYSHCAR